MKAYNRQELEEVVLLIAKEIDPSGRNVEKYKKILPKMSEEHFKEFCKGIKDGSRPLVIFAEHFKSSKITTENNLKVAKKYDLPLYERLRYVGNPDIPDHISAQEVLVVDLGINRKAQNIVKKISVPKDNKTIDYMTYQPTGESKGSSLSQPEEGVLIGMGLDNSIDELSRFLGGDKGGFRAYNASIARFGTVRLEAIRPFTTGVESTNVTKAYLNAMMLNLED